MDGPLGRLGLYQAFFDRTGAWLKPMRLFLVVAYGVSAAFYFAWRPSAMNPAFPLWSLFVLAAEFSGFLWSLTFLLPALELPERAHSPARAGLTVDVFVPTYDEPIEIVSRTLLAAASIRYPHETWLLDDGDREEMRELASSLGCRYLAREGNTDAKAGNLNHALSHSNAEFIALFDADHVADTTFLDRCLGYFEDESVAFVQTPQEFYNYDSHQHLTPRRFHSNEHSLFYHVVQRSRDRWNAAMFCGCAAVIRRSALDSIGGVATGTVTEDMHTSVRLHAKGWRSVFHPEVLSAGVAPLDAQSFRSQRLRWAQGSMQVAWQERILTRPGLSFVQRFFYMLHVLNHLEGWRHAFFFLLPAIVLTTGLSPIRASAWTYIVHLAPYFMLGLLTYRELGRDHGRFFESEVFNMARCATSVRATFAMFRKHLPFRVTPKTKSARGSRAGAFPWIVLSLTLASLAIVSLGPMHATHSSTIAGMWGLFSAGLSIRLILLSRRCRKNRRLETRLPCDFPVTIDGAIEAGITDATVSGFTLRPRGDKTISPGTHAGRVTASDEICEFTIDLSTRGNNTLGGAVHWNDERSRRSFDLALHQHAIRRIAAQHCGERRGLLSRLAAAGAVVATALAFVAVASGNARADGIVLAGTDVSSTASYTYAGAILPPSPSAEKNGIVTRLWSDRLTYTYVSNSQRVSASSWGQSLSAGYHFTNSASDVSLFAGLDNRTTRLLPDLGVRNEGTHLGTRFEGDLLQHLAPTVQFVGIASTVTSTADYWTRAQLLFGKTISAGPEYVAQGNTNYREQRAGIAIGGLAIGPARVGIEGGRERLNGATSSYVSMSLSTGVH